MALEYVIGERMMDELSSRSDLWRFFSLGEDGID